MLLSLLSKRTLHADSRDAYGFNVRPQHLHTFREYANIYKEEEEERLHKWKGFLENQAESTSANVENIEPVISEVTKQQSELENTAQKTEPVEDSNREGESVPTKEAPITQHGKSREVQTWAIISPYLKCIENLMSVRVKKKIMKDEKMRQARSDLPSIDEEGLEESSVDGDVFYDNEIMDDDGTDIASAVKSCASDKLLSEEHFFRWKQELEFLVHGGIPKDLRGEVWQAFVGVRTRRVEKYYQYLLAIEIDASDGKLSGDGRTTQHNNEKRFDLPEKWKKQIEKVVRCMGPGLYRSIFLIRSS